MTYAQFTKAMRGQVEIGPHLTIYLGTKPWEMGDRYWGDMAVFDTDYIRRLPPEAKDWGDEKILDFFRVLERLEGITE